MSDQPTPSNPIQLKAIRLHELYQEYDRLMEPFAQELEALKKLEDDLRFRASEAVRDVEEEILQLSLEIINSGITSSVTFEEAPDIHIRYRKGYYRTTWDSDKLIKLAEENPVILSARKVTEIPENISIVRENKKQKE